MSSDDEPLVARSVAFTDLDATRTTALSSTTPASSQALVRVQPISGDEDDEDLLHIRQQVEGTHVRRRTRRRVLSDDLPLTQVLPAVSQLASRRVVVPGVSGDTPRSGPDRSDSGEDGEDEFDAGVPTVPGPVSAPSWVTRNRFAALQRFDQVDEVFSLPASLCNALEFDLIQADSGESAGDTINTYRGGASAGGVRGRRRLVLISQNVPASGMDGVDPGAHSESATSVPPEDPDDPAEEDEASSEGPHDIPSDDEVEEEAPFRLPGAAAH